MRQYAYMDNEVEEISLGKQRTTCKCFMRPVNELCDLIKKENRCCLGTSITCEQNNCPNNQK